MKKVLWIGDGVRPTGFSRVNHSILDGFDLTKFEIDMVAVNYDGDPHSYPYRIYPARNGGDIYGLGKVKELVKSKVYDLIFILNDAWVINQYLGAIKEVTKEIPTIVVYFPVDAVGHVPDFYSNFDIVTTAVVYTQFGYDVATATHEFEDIRIIPHGVDTKLFYPTDKQEARKKVFGEDYEIHKDSFIILNANRNQPRKQIDTTIMAFSLFAENKPDVRLYYHGGMVDAGWDIAQLITFLGLGDKFIVTSRQPSHPNVSTESLNTIYNMADVGVNTSLGEGWGLISIEHAMTGAAQIVPAHSACRELFAKCGALVQPITTAALMRPSTIGARVRAEDVATAFELLYKDVGLKQSLEEAALKEFSQSKYDWKVISKSWMDLFDEVIK